jgi:hypothetical protein
MVYGMESETNNETSKKGHSMTYRKISVIPTTAAIKQSRQIQSAVDKAKHDEYHEAEVKAEVLMNKLSTSVRKQSAKPVRLNKQQVEAIKATPDWKKTHSVYTEKSMRELMSQPGFARNDDDNRNMDAPNQGSVITSAKYDDQGRILPQSGQWYNFVNQNYRLMLEGDKVYFMSNDDFGTLKYLYIRIDQSPIGGVRNVICPSIGRFFDLLNSQPSLDDLKKAGYKTELLRPAELLAFGNPDFENSIPIFSK